MARQAKRSAGCIDCGFCEYYVGCGAAAGDCVGCGACVRGCPTGARWLVPVPDAAAAVTIRVDGETCSVPGGTTLAAALATLGKQVEDHHCCSIGACGACAVVVDDALALPCTSGVRAGMDVVTDREAVERRPPQRVVSFLPEHLHASLSVFTHGCNYSCSFCHNWDIAFSSREGVFTPEEAARETRRLTAARGNRRTGVSGGEATLNRRWLVEYVRRVREDSPGVRIQLDTNASLLTPDYLEELWDAGVTDISPDLKGLELASFQRVTGVDDPALAARYLERSWKAVEEIVVEYAGRLHATVALPFHPELIPAEELLRMGGRLAEMRRGLDVNLIVYQPAFRRWAAPPAPAVEAAEIAAALGAGGLRVWLQAGQDIPPPTMPDELSLSSEEFF